MSGGGGRRRRKLKEREQSEDRGIDGQVVLEWIVVRYGLDASGPG